MIMEMGAIMITEMGTMMILGEGDDEEPAGCPPVWEKGFKPPPDSSFMFLK